MQKLNPTHNKERPAKFLEKINWNNSAFNQHVKQKMQNLLVNYNSNFARHWSGLLINMDCFIKLTPEHTQLEYTPYLSTPIQLRDEMLIELALMQDYEIITTLLFSKYSSPLLAPQTLSGKLRILIDLRRINHFLRQNYTINKLTI